MIRLGIEAATAMAAAVLVVGSIVGLGVGRKLLRLRREQARPRVLVYVRQDPASPSVLQIVIENTGGGTAFDVECKLNRPLPYNAFGVSAKEAERRGEPSSRVYLVRGRIPALAPGGRRVMDWGQLGGLERALGKKRVRVTTRFRSRDGWRGKCRSSLEVRSFEGWQVAEREPAGEASRTLKRMDATLSALNLNLSRMQGMTLKESRSGTRADVGIEAKPMNGRRVENDAIWESEG